MKMKESDYLITVVWNGLGGGGDFDIHSYTVRFTPNWLICDAYKYAVSTVRGFADDVWIKRVSTSRNVGVTTKGASLELMDSDFITPWNTIKMQRMWWWFRQCPSLTRMDTCLSLMEDEYVTDEQLEKFERMALGLING